jgi:glutamyl-tRNA(Gln) amidotransferase subunit E (EC 6.3.5.7)
MSIDRYEELGLIAGLEIHQQLDTDTKLFCRCPTVLQEPAAATDRFVRYLHPTTSELGEVDAAALEEAQRADRFEYLAYESTCLVEADEEPPHEMNPEALGIAVQLAQMMQMAIVDVAPVMRKLVIDGSNTSGFQRTALIGKDGHITVGETDIGIEDLLLEEEAAQRVDTDGADVTYSLDRLGIPLVEIGTAPDITSPEEAQAVAAEIGMILRSTGAVKRGLGSIRQDVNVSIAEGARVEIKGVQQLQEIEAIVRAEVDRQVALLEIRDELADRDVAIDAPTEVTSALAETDASLIRAAIDAEETVLGVRLVGFDGLLGRSLQPDRRLGSELADHARKAGAGGLFHSDELPAYGLDTADVEAVEDTLGVGPDDAFVLIAAEQSVAERAMEAVCARAASIPEGVPEETRAAMEGGASRYLRPLPGAARMYPETDVPPVPVDRAAVAVPELLRDRISRYETEYGLSADLARGVADSRWRETFDAAVTAGVEPTLAASTLTETMTMLRRDGVAVTQLRDEAVQEVLTRCDAGALAKEAIAPVLEALAAAPERSVEAAIEAADAGGVDAAVVDAVVEAVIESNAEQVRSEGMGAFSALMGEAMAELRGRADGELVSDRLRAAIAQQQPD